VTLDTKILILDRMPHRDVFVKCNQLLGATEATKSHDEQLGSWRKDGPPPGAPWRIGNEIAQGLPALLDIYYRPDGPLRASDGDCHWFCDPDCDEDDDTRACWLEVSFDTAYGYRDEQGRGCGDLHASLVAQLGLWLDERGVRWLWRNEFTGEIHSGYDRLTDLCTDGAQATAWFRTSVLPAIEREAGR